MLPGCSIDPSRAAFDGKMAFLPRFGVAECAITLMLQILKETAAVF